MNFRKKKMMAGILAVILVVAGWAYVDYRRWLALGPGGVPYNLYGWAQVTWLRLWKKNPLDTTTFEKYIGKQGDTNGLGTLPTRGRRPSIH